MVEVNGEYKDLNIEISADSKVKIITIDDDYALELLRHDSALYGYGSSTVVPGTKLQLGL